MSPLMALLALCFTQTSGVQQPAHAVDPQTGVVHSRRLANGLPLGGIGAGSIELMSDGSFSHATITNNWSHPSGDLSGCFGALWTRSDGKTVARALELSNPYGLPVMPSVDFDGVFPEALMVMSDPQLPVLVTVEAFSPLEPGDLLNSSLPGAVYLVRLRNKLSRAIDVSVALSWENLLGGSTTGPGASRTGDTVETIPSADGFYGMRFATPTVQAGGEVRPSRDNAAGEMSLLALPPNPHSTVTEAGWNAHAGRPEWWDGFAATGDVTGTVGTGVEGSVHPAGVVAVRFTLPPERFVEIPFAVTWNVPHLYTTAHVDLGHYYSITFPTAESVARHLLSDRLDLKALTDEWQNRILFSDLPRPLARTIINAASPLITHSVLCEDGRFALLEHTGAPQNGGGGRNQTGLISIVDRLAVSSLLTSFYPRLDAQELAEFAEAEGQMSRIPRTLGFLEAGIPLGAGRSPVGRRPGPTRLMLEDLLTTSAFTIQLAQYVDWTGDGAFLLQHFRTARRAITALLDSGTDPLPKLPVIANDAPDALIDSGRPLDCAAATLWLAALRAAQRMAAIASLRALQETSPAEEARDQPENLNEIVGSIAALAVDREQDADFEQRVTAAADAVQAEIERRFWNGSWYTDLPDTGATGTLSYDSMLGLWAASMLDDPLPLPHAHVSAAASVLNSRYDSLSAATALPPQRLSDQGGVPSGDTRGADSVIPAAVLLHTAMDIRLGMPEVGLQMMERIATVLQDADGCVWTSPARFQSASNLPVHPGLDSAMFAAAWYLNNAIEGMGLDLASAHLRLTPHIPGLWRGLRAPLFAPTFWGRMQFRPLAHGYVLTAYIDRTMALSPHPTIMPSSSAALSVGLLTVPGARNGGIPTVHVSVGNRSLGAKVRATASGNLQLTLDTPVSLVAGDRLEVEVLE